MRGSGWGWVRGAVGVSLVDILQLLLRALSVDLSVFNGSRSEVAAAKSSATVTYCAFTAINCAGTNWTRTFQAESSQLIACWSSGLECRPITLTIAFIPRDEMLISGANVPLLFPPRW